MKRYIPTLTPSRLLAVAASIFFAASSSPAQVIYSDDFSGLVSDNLNGLSPDTRPGTETWTARTSDTAQNAWKADGTATSANNANIVSNAFLPFTPTGGKIYELSMETNITTTTNGWVALGFTQHAATSAGFFSSGVGTVVNAAPWMLMRSVNNTNTPGSRTDTYQGPGTSVATVSYPTLQGANQLLKLQLDTTASAWKATWFVNGNEIRDVTYGTNPTINYVGFGLNVAATSGIANATVDDFQLLAIIPEPSSLALAVGFGWLFLLCRRRR